MSSQIRFVSKSLLSVFVITLLSLSALSGVSHAQENPFANDTSTAKAKATPAVAEPAVKPNVPPTIAEQPAETEDLQTLLNQNMSFSYEDVPFGDVRQELANSLRKNILLDESAKDDALDEDTAIAFSVENTKLSTAIRLMLKPHNATYVIKDDIMLIISLDVAGDPRYFVRRVFDCRDLLEAIQQNEERFPNPHGLGVRRDAPLHGGGKGVPSNGGGVFNLNATMQEKTADDEKVVPPETSATPAVEAPPAEAKPDEPKIIASEILESTIKLTIWPDDWYDTNGDASISFLAGVLIFSGHQEHAEEVEAFLDQLNEALTN